MKDLGSMITREWLVQCAKLRTMLVDARRGGLDVRFRLPPKEFVVLLPLTALIDRLACNDDSLAVGRALAVARSEGSAGGATVFMLNVALEAAGIPFERASLQELGLGPVELAIEEMRSCALNRAVMPQALRPSRGPRRPTRCRARTRARG